MNVLITTLGTLGDLNPLRYLGEAFRNQGDKVIFLINPVFRDYMESAGFTVIAPGDAHDMSEYLKNNRDIVTYRGTQKYFKEFIFPQVPLQYHSLCDTIKSEKIDLVVSPFFCWWAEWACSDLNISHVTVHFSPLALFSAKDPCYSLFGFRFIPRYFRGQLIRLGKVIQEKQSAKVLNGLASSMNLTNRNRSYFTSKERSILTLALWSRSFRNETKDDPKNILYTNFVRPLVENDEISSDTLKFLDHQSDPIVVGLGTSARNIAEKLYLMIARVCDRLSIPCILIGTSNSSVYTQFKNVHVTPFEPFEAIFKRSSMVIHHGGVSTMAAAFRSGKPSLIIPFMFDQFDNALRSSDLGVARCISHTSASERKLEVEINRILSNKDLLNRSMKLSEVLLREENGAIKGARMIKEVFASNNEE